MPPSKKSTSSPTCMRGSKFYQPKSRPVAVGKNAAVSPTNTIKIAKVWMAIMSLRSTKLQQKFAILVNTTTKVNSNNNNNKKSLQIVGLWPPMCWEIFFILKTLVRIHWIFWCICNYYDFTTPIHLLPVGCNLNGKFCDPQYWGLGSER